MVTKLHCTPDITALMFFSDDPKVWPVQRNWSLTLSQKWQKSRLFQQASSFGSGLTPQAFLQMLPTSFSLSLSLSCNWGGAFLQPCRTISHFFFFFPLVPVILTINVDHYWYFWSANNSRKKEEKKEESEINCAKKSLVSAVSIT